MRSRGEEGAAAGVEAPSSKMNRGGLSIVGTDEELPEESFRVSVDSFDEREGRLR